MMCICKSSLKVCINYWFHVTKWIWLYIVSESAHSALLAFSIYTNGKKILKTTDDSGQILFFNGMRVLSMFWVIMGHRYQLLESQVPNLEEAKAVSGFSKLLSSTRKLWNLFIVDEEVVCGLSYNGTSGSRYVFIYIWGFAGVHISENYEKTKSEI